MKYLWIILQWVWFPRFVHKNTDLSIHIYMYLPMQQVIMCPCVLPSIFYNHQQPCFCLLSKTTEMKFKVLCHKDWECYCFVKGPGSWMETQLLDDPSDDRWCGYCSCLAAQVWTGYCCSGSIWKPSGHE